MLDPQLKDKVVLITGANNPFGIGAAAARALAGQGARVFLHYYRSADITNAESSAPATSPGAAFYRLQQMKSADEVVDGIRRQGGEVWAFEADLADGSVVPGLFDRAEAALGPVEVLVNNAAHWGADTFLPHEVDRVNRLVELWTDRSQPITGEHFDRTFAVNALAPALLMAEFTRRHVARGARWGRIINVSTAGAHCFPSEVTYGSSKFALESYTRSASQELGRFGVTVNVLALGPVQTGWITRELEQAILPGIPLGRVGTPQDVADVIVFLASDQARWVTGQRIYVGGGREV
ncbi:MAG: SDR family NAD(P)-dependent oxidoreductase [Vicinamibacterales bacterium]